MHPPPRSTLFPTRRSSDLQEEDQHEPASCDVPTQQEPSDGNREDAGADRVQHAPELLETIPDEARRVQAVVREHRSEEHTSELQSRRDLVCRLLLEKKKKN